MTGSLDRDSETNGDFTANEPSHNVGDATDAKREQLNYEAQSTTRVTLLLVSVFTSLFLVALDRTIIATAIPQISNEFNSLPDVGWYGSAYTLASCSFQLLLGKLYTFWAVKAVLLGNVVLFEVGSALCGAAPSSTAFIVGRAFAGVGAAGIFSGAIVCIVYAIPLEKRPRLNGAFGALMGVAAIMSPLIGGAFTTNVSWRWCFYINLPIGGVTMAIIALCLQVPERDTTKLPWTKKLAQLDGPGTGSFIPCMVCLLLALQWGGQTYAWNNGRIITLLTLTGVLAIAFVSVQIFRPNTATIPPRIFKQRSIAAGLWSTFCVGASMYLYTYFLPIWFQSIQGVSAVQSGIRLLPTMLAMVAANIIGGFSIQKVGYYTPFAIFGGCVMAIGSGLLTTLEVDSNRAEWIGYQVLYGFGMGFAFQAPNMAAQTVLPTKDVPIGSSLMFFGQLLGATVFISVGENLLDNQLLKRLSGIPGFAPNMVTSGGATALISSLPASERLLVLEAYNQALRVVFQAGLVMSCLTVVGVVFLEWKSVRKEAAKQSAGATAKDTEEGKEKSNSWQSNQ